MILYMDTSALVKRYILEQGSQEINGIIEKAGAVGSVMLTRVEMASAFSKAIRMEWVDATGVENAWRDFQDQWQSFVRLSVTPVLVDRASGFARQYGLRAYDATHLAAALIWQEILEAPVTIATYDRELWLASEKAGLYAWPQGLA